MFQILKTCIAVWLNILINKTLNPQLNEQRKHVESHLSKTYEVPRLWLSWEFLESALLIGQTLHTCSSRLAWLQYIMPKVLLQFLPVSTYSIHDFQNMFHCMQIYLKIKFLISGITTGSYIVHMFIEQLNSWKERSQNNSVEGPTWPHSVNIINVHPLLAFCYFPFFESWVKF